jgi:hypothetical protein
VVFFIVGCHGTLNPRYIHRVNIDGADLKYEIITWCLRKSQYRTQEEEKKNIFHTYSDFG